MADPNSLPVAAADAATVGKNGTVSATGNVLSNDTDADGNPLTVATVNGVAATAGTTTITGVYGSLAVGNNGQYTYALANSQANVQALGAGQSATDVFHYTVSDGFSHTTTVTASNMLAQSEAFNTWSAFSGSGTQPAVTTNIATNPVGTGSTADRLTLTGGNTGVYTQTPITGQSTFSVWVRLVSGDGNLSLNYYDGSAGHLQSIVATSAWQRLSLTFTGNGNAADNVALMHSATQTATGTFEVFGAQVNAGSTAGPYYATTGTAGSGTVTTTAVAGADLTVTVTGKADPVNALPVAAADAATVAKNGTVSATGNVLSNDTDADGNPLTVATVNGVAATAGTTTITGVYGSLAVGSNGQYTYALANNQANVQALGAGQSATDVFHYTVSDGFSHTTTVTASNMLAQSEAFNTWSAFSSGGTQPVVATNVATNPVGTGSTADRLTLTGGSTGVYTQTPITGQATFSVWVRLVSGDGNLSLNYYDGSTSHLQSIVATSAWQRLSLTFTGNGNAADNVALMHSATQTATGTFEVFGAQVNAGSTAGPYYATTGTAGSGTVTTAAVAGADLTVTVTGKADPVNALPVAAADAATVAKNGTVSATGNVLSNDTDADGNPLTVATVNGVAATAGTITITGVYGSLAVGNNGQYTYSLANNQANVQALGAGQSATDVFHYTVSDGFSHTTAVTASNMLAQSEAFNTWSAFSSGGTQPAVATNIATNPVGTGSTADRLTLTGGSTGVYTQTPITGQSTFSVWVRLVSGDGNLSLNYYDGANDHLQSVVATSAWQRLSLTFTGNGNAADNVALMQSATQTATGTFEVFGAQVNAGSTAGPYYATTGTAGSSTVQTPVPLGADLTVTVAGSAGPTPAPLSFATTTNGIVANLATHSWANALKVMPLGDSITYGWTQQDKTAQSAGVQASGISNGYRAPLFYDFAQHDALVDWVGSQNTGSGYALDQDHAGFPGYRTDQLAALLPNLMTTQKPDAILMMAGINDIYQLSAANALSSIQTNTRAMLDAAYAANPNETVYVAALLQTTNADASTVNSANAALKTIVQQYAAAGHATVWVDTSAVMTTDLFDGTHPTEAGYAKLATVWYNAIQANQPIVGGTPGGVAHTIASGTAAITGGGGNDLLVGDAGANALSGGAGNDRLEGGGGDDILTGGTGSDQFVFTNAPGHVAVTDFNQFDRDILDFQGIPGLTSYQTLASQISQGGGATTINLTSFVPNESVTLVGFTGHLTATDVLFS